MAKNVNTLATNFLANKTLKETYSYLDVLQNEHSAIFTVAKSTEADILQDVHSALLDAKKEGKTLKQFTKELKPTLAQKGWWGKKIDVKTGKVIKLGSPRRLKTIYDTNKRSARASATWQNAQNTKKFAPYFKYQVGPSRVHREQHLAWAGTILPIDHPFWDYAFPPNGWGCKCFVTQITKNQAKKAGGVSKSPKMSFNTKQVNGKEVKYLKGTDLSFSTNSGKFRYKVLSESYEQKLLSYPKGQAKSSIQGFVKSNYFKSYFNYVKKVQEEVKTIRNRVYNFSPVAYLSKGLTSKGILRLTEETLANKKFMHPDIKVSDYALIQNIVDTGVYNKGNYVKEIDKKYYLVSTKKTKNNECILSSFYRIDESKYNKIISK